MKFPVLWSGLYCYTVKCSKILAHIKLLYNPRVNKVFRFSKMTRTAYSVNGDSEDEYSAKIWRMCSPGNRDMYIWD